MYSFPGPLNFNPQHVDLYALMVVALEKQKQAPTVMGFMNGMPQQHFSYNII